jgi:hypothetical protein
LGLFVVVGVPDLRRRLPRATFEFLRHVRHLSPANDVSSVQNYW